MEKLKCTSTKDNKKVIELIFKYLVNKKSNLLFLCGDMGSGKTTLTYDIAKFLNTKHQVSSPTFVIQKIYKLGVNNFNFSNIYHIDLYRLIDICEINDLNLFEDIADKKNLFIIEWPEKVKHQFTNYVSVNIKVYKNGSRLFMVD